jgi:hypothetical protein
MKWPHVRRMVNDIQQRVYQATASSLKPVVTAAL